MTIETLVAHETHERTRKADQPEFIVAFYFVSFPVFRGQYLS